MNKQSILIANNNPLKIISLLSAIGLTLLLNVSQAQMRGDELANVDPSFQEFSIGDFIPQNTGGENIRCETNGACRYGVDVKFLNPNIDEDTFTFSIGIRAQQDLPDDNISLTNLGNLLTGYTFDIFHSGSGGVDLNELGGASNCTFASSPAVATRSNPVFGLLPNAPERLSGGPFSRLPSTAGDGVVQSYTLQAAYLASNPVDITDPVYLSSQEFTPILDFTCDISGVTNAYASLDFSTSGYAEILQLHASNSFVAYAARYTNSLEFFPLDGTSAYIEEAHLADTNRHAFIKFSEDLPDDLVLSASMFGASHDSYDDDGLFSSFSGSTIEATSVSKIASDTVWVTFPDALATAIANGNGLLHDVLLDFQPGTDGFIDTVSGGEKRALYRVSAQYGEFGSSDNTGVPPRISSMEFNDTRDLLTATFDQAVSSLPTTETSVAIVPLTADDFELLYWDGENSEKVSIEIVQANNAEYVITLPDSVASRAASATNPVYFQLRTNPASAPSDAPQNQFYITTATVFSFDPAGQVARTLPSPGVSGDYGIGMRDIPGNGLIRFPELNVAPTITPALAVILAEDVDASNPMRTALLSQAGSGNMRLTIADGNDDGSVLPTAATLRLTWSELPLNFEIPSYNSNILFDSITNVFEDASGGSIQVDASLNTISQVNGFLAGIEFTYGDFTGAARFTLTFNDGGNAPVGEAMEASAQIVITKDQIPPTIGSGVVSALEPRGTSTTISWTAATDQAGALDANGNPADGATSNDQIGYVIKIMDISRDITGAVDFRTGNASTTQEIAIPVGELTGPGLLQYGLDRSNTVLIPGRTYEIRIRAVDSAGLMSEGENTDMIKMGPSIDSNKNGIEDSIEAVGVVSNVDTYCGGSASEDSDGDGISNGRELEIGTDCRTAANAGGFNDSGLTIDGANDLMLSLRITEASNDDIADVYTVSNLVAVANIGLTKIDRTKMDRDSLATVTCPDNDDCATIRPLLVVESDEVCMNNLGGKPDTDLVMPAGISGTLCQVRDEDNIYLPVGFSEVIWKVQDSSGNILISSSSNNLRQLYYVAPEINVYPRKRYSMLFDSNPTTSEDFVATVSVNFGETSRYDGMFEGDISIDSFSFMLDLSSEEGTISPSGTGFGESSWSSANGVSTLEYVAYTVFAEAVDEPGVLGTLRLDISGITTIESTGHSQLMINRQDPNTYAYKIGNVEQEIEVIKGIIPAPTISFASGSGDSSDTLTITNNDYDSEGQVMLISLFDSSSDMEVGEDVFSSITEFIRAGNISSIDIAIRDSSNLAMRLRIFAPEDEALSNPLYERYCYYNNGQFCNAPESLFTASDYTSTSPSRIASVELVSNIPHRAEGRYSANLVLDSNTSPEMKAMADTERFGGYSQFPSITFNVDSVNVNNGVFSQMIAVVIKLPAALPDAGAYMHKYIDSEWRAFVEQERDDNEGNPGEQHGRLYSADSTANSGNCPALVSPRDAGGLSSTSADSGTNGDWSDIIDTATLSVLWYRTTRPSTRTSTLDSLRAGDDCVLMWIADGGANDADGVRNGIVSDPSRIGAPADGSVATGRRGGGGGGGGGGAVNTGLLFLLMLIAGAALIQRRKVAATHS